jgi:AmmeMemoRadiSam system protein A
VDPTLGRRLLALARWTLERWSAGQAWRTGGPALAEDEDRPIDGLFVTLRRDEELRGCIGTIARQPSLDATLREMAVKAASSDPRFQPVSATELPVLHLAVSVLTPPTAVDDPAEIEIGRDGLIVERGTRKGLLLPEVPVELGWDRERFLAEVCLKAFLPETAWQEPGTRLYRFGSEQASEDALTAPPADRPD